MEKSNFGAQYPGTQKYETTYCSIPFVVKYFLKSLHHAPVMRYKPFYGHVT